MISDDGCYLICSRVSAHVGVLHDEKLSAKDLQDFNQEADRLEADAKGHAELADVYRQSPNTFVPKGGGPGIFRTAEHCDSAAKSLREAAKDLRELAAEHEQMAKDVAK